MNTVVLFRGGRQPYGNELCNRTPRYCVAATDGHLKAGHHKVTDDLVYPYMYLYTLLGQSNKPSLSTRQSCRLTTLTGWRDGIRSHVKTYEGRIRGFSRIRPD